MNCKDVNKWSTDIVAIIPSFVESEKGYFGYVVTILEIKAFFREICEASITLLQCTESSPVSCMVILATSLDRVRVFNDVVLKTATSGEKYMRNNAYN